MPDWVEKIAVNPTLWVPFTILLLSAAILLIIWKVVVPMLQARAGLIGIHDSEYEEPKRVPILSRAFVEKFEERGKELYRAITQLQIQQGRIDHLERELKEMTVKVDAQTDRHQALREEFVEIRGNLREVKSTLQRLAIQVAQMQGPIHDIAAWISRKSGFTPSPTPVPLPPLDEEGL